MIQLHSGSRKFLIIYSLFLFYSEVFATHIIGGDMRYKCLGADLYEITMTLRRDCINGNPAAQFDNPAAIGIFNANGELQGQLGQAGRLLMNYRRDDTLNEFLTKNCGIIGGDVCVHTTTYKEIVSLPFVKGGYILAYQRCCRNFTIQNIIDPLSTGATYTLEITEEALLQCNSSPVLIPYPPVYICGGQPFLFELSAKDEEGDSLVYLLCDPYHGANQINPRPDTPSAPPYLVVTYKPPYRRMNMMGGLPPLQIDPQTGVMTGYAENFVAQYLVAYCVEEYRNGKLLSVLRRDFQINVRICNSVPLAKFECSIDPCSFPVQLKLKDKSEDLFSVIDSWSWLVQLNSISYFSFDQNPVFEFTDTGIASIRLIVHSKESCSDTMYKVISIQSLKPEFIAKDRMICQGDSVELVSVFKPGLRYTWIPSTGLSCTNCPDPKASPASDITYVLSTTNGSCNRLDTVKIRVENCTLDSCEIAIKKVCLPNGMIEITAVNARGNKIEPKQRKHELFWDIKKNINHPAVSILNTNPILLNPNRTFSLTSKLYSWKQGVPKTVEFADICTRRLDDASDLSCNGPCSDLQFILSSCEDDYHKDHQLNYPSGICESICSNACQYIVALFETNGTLIDPSVYNIKWSTGGTGSHVMLMGPYYNTLTVEVGKGDCKWYGRYWKSCKQYSGSLFEDLPGMHSKHSDWIDLNVLTGFMKMGDKLDIYHLDGRPVSHEQLNHLPSGIYVIVRKHIHGTEVYKMFR